MSQLRTREVVLWLDPDARQCGRTLAEMTRPCISLSVSGSLTPVQGDDWPISGLEVRSPQFSRAYLLQFCFMHTRDSSPRPRVLGGSIA